MNLKRVGPVFERVLLMQFLARQLPRLTHRYEARSDCVCDRRGKDVTTSLDADDVVDPTIVESLDKKVDRAAKALLISQQRGNVTEKDPGNRKVRDRSNQGFDLHGGPGLSRGVEWPAERIDHEEAARPSRRASGVACCKRCRSRARRWQREYEHDHRHKRSSCRIGSSRH